MGRPTKLGNPWKVAVDETAEECAALHSEMLAGSDELRLQAQRELRGRGLACWWAPSAPCHADILLEVADAELGAPGPN